jgi:hypothetical protein
MSVGFRVPRSGTNRVGETLKEISGRYVTVYRGFELYTFLAKTFTLIEDQRIHFEIVDSRPHGAILMKMPLGELSFVLPVKHHS